MYAKIGITVHLDAVSKSIHFPKVLDRTTDFYMLGWGVPTLDSQYVFQFLFDKSGAWNATGFDNARINEITILMSKEVDQVKRDKLIAKHGR